MSAVPVAPRNRAEYRRAQIHAGTVPRSPPDTTLLISVSPCSLFSPSSTILFRILAELARQRESLYLYAKIFFKLNQEGFLGDPNGTELRILRLPASMQGSLPTLSQSGHLSNSWSIAMMDESKRPLVTIAFPGLLHKKSFGDAQ